MTPRTGQQEWKGEYQEKLRELTYKIILVLGVQHSIMILYNWKRN